MIDERGRAFAKNNQFFCYQFAVIIYSFRPVSSHIVADSPDHVFCRAIQYDESMNGDNCRHIPGLAEVSRHAVQDQYIVLPEALPLEKEGDDFFCQSKMLILEQQPLFEDAVYKSEFRR